jgi:hypothetical protein
MALPGDSQNTHRWVFINMSMTGIVFAAVIPLSRVVGGWNTMNREYDFSKANAAPSFQFQRVKRASLSVSIMKCFLGSKTTSSVPAAAATRSSSIRS